VLTVRRARDREWFPVFVGNSSAPLDKGRLQSHNQFDECGDAVDVHTR
jgi:hypothetical protein